MLDPRSHRRNDIQLLWIEFPLLNQHVPKDTYCAHMSQVCTWSRLCSDGQVPFVLFRSAGRKWQDPQLDLIREESVVYSSAHRACAFKVKVGVLQKESSLASFLALSTIKIPSSPCKCRVDKGGHALDWETKPASSQDHLRLRAQQAGGCMYSIRFWLR